jgi:hypothetical protein
MKIEQVLENLTSPPVAIPTSSAGVFAINFIASLPVLLNSLWITYVLILLLKEIYKLYKEIKEDRKLKNGSSPSE